MARSSIIYRHLIIYRAVMNILYGGVYNERFKPIIRQIEKLPDARTVLELCFADLHIASFCNKTKRNWIGFDINEQFVKHAKKNNYHAEQKDLLTVSTLPPADLCIMMGSFYHFHGSAEAVLERMLKAAPVILLSEPVSNLSSRGGLLGFIARKSANAGNGEETFRYSRESILEFLNHARHRLNFEFTILEQFNKDIIIKIEKHASTRG